MTTREDGGPKPHTIPGMGKARIAALRWFAEHGPAHLFGADDPSLSMVKWLEKYGFVVAVGRVRDIGVPFAFTSYGLTDAGRAMIAERNK